MANLHSTSAVITVTSAPSLRITVGTGLTGTITVADSTGTISVITNPVVGNYFDFAHLVGTTTVTPSGSCDITVTTNTHTNR